MNQIDFGKLVAALRDEHYWSNIDLANAFLNAQSKYSNIDNNQKPTNSSVITIRKIVNGKLKKLTPAILVPLADALRLTSRERQEFFYASLGIEDEQLSMRSNPNFARLTMEKALGNMQAPAFITDCYAEILALNPAMLAMYLIDISELEDPKKNNFIRYNTMRMFFADEFAQQRELISDFKKFAYQSVMVFRTVTLKYRADPKFQARLNMLFQELPLFRRHWERTHSEKLFEDHQIDNPTMLIKLSDGFTINCITSSISMLTSVGELKLYTFLPQNDETRSAFQFFSDEYETGVIRTNAEWPKL